MSDFQRTMSCRGESNSITNQKRMLEEYAERNGYDNIRHYTDDGWSGANFERPQWKKLVEDIESGDIGIVIVKDMSRVGRDYLQVGFYTEVMFKQKKVRFIAIANGVDSNNRESAEFAPFLNIMNEWYVRDASRKITTVLHNKGASGKAHLTNNVIYGYKADPNDKEHWIIDEEAAEVVRRMFRLCINGYGPWQIASILMEDKVERPSYYLGKKGLGTNASIYSDERRYIWTGTTVSEMLSKPEYAGHTVNFRTYKESYKYKRTYRAPKEKWVIFKNTQEAIVDEHTFNTVQELRKTVRRPDTSSPANPLTGKMYCADCGAKMYNHRHKSYENRRAEDSYQCSSYSLGKQHKEHLCNSHTIRTVVTNNLILDTIRRTCNYAIENEKQFREIVSNVSEKQKEERRRNTKKRINKNEKRRDDINRLIKKMYEDNVNGKLSDKQFAVMIKDYEEELSELEKSLENDYEEIEKDKNETANTDMFLMLAKRYTDFEEITPAMINEFVSKVLVHEAMGIGASRTQEVEIYLNYIGKIEIPQEEVVLTEEEREQMEKERIRLDRKRESNRKYMARKREEARMEKALLENNK